MGVKGWCPGALSPMMSGDGLVVRVRPRLARLSREQALGLAEAAARFGSGIVELTRRANVQLRGVRDHAGVVRALGVLGLLDADTETERRRNILVSPLWHTGDVTERLALELESRLDELPSLPAKFGFAVDTGEVRLLSGAPADVRIERGAFGLVVRADGAETGRSVSEAEAVDLALDLAGWFARERGAARRIRQLEPPAGWQGAMPGAEAALVPGESRVGPVRGVAFGQVSAADLGEIVERSGAKALRFTPWRSLVLERGAAIDHVALIADAGDPLLGVDACPGAPACASATVETRGLARALAGRMAGTLHVSGCAKGCARSQAADVTLMGREGRFDLVRQGRAGDAPERCGLTPVEVLEMEFG